MYVAGIDAHTSYLVVAVVSNGGALVEKRRVHVHRPDQLDGLLAGYRPLEVVVETSSAWPWLRDRLEPQHEVRQLPHEGAVVLEAWCEIATRRERPLPVLGIVHVHRQDRQSVLDMLLSHLDQMRHGFEAGGSEGEPNID